jgi:aryl-alcohol dehydrogenase-like predicted oxidoreductase
MGRRSRSRRIMLIVVVSFLVPPFHQNPSIPYLPSPKTGLSRTAIFEAVNASLARLQLDHLDLLQIHRFDPHTPLEETMLALHDLVRAGKVHYIGASSMWAWQFAQLQHVAEKNGWTKFISMQNHYNLLYREEEREMNAFCDATGVGLIPWAPLSRGHLARPLEAFGSTMRSEGEKKSGGEQSEADREIVRRVQEVAEKKGWKMSHVALAWINKRVSAPIIGFSSVERMDEALDAGGKELTEEEEKFLEEPYKPKAIVGHS